MEENGLISEIGNWVLDSAIRQCSEWLSYAPDFCMNINVAYEQFVNPDFKLTVLHLLNTYNVNPRRITLELTESGKMELRGNRQSL